ncbi:MAG: hypothetical protein KC912_11785 [Proteobacteria bacterium]|nr:hypothetical protein [Pseudomonadota bacterium]
MTSPHPSELRDADRHDALDGDAFVARQRRARERAAQLASFYRRYPSRTGPLHEVAAASIALARFAGRSEAYHAIGEGLMPTNAAGEPRTPSWAAYIASHVEQHPDDVREEWWLVAHLEDMEAVRAAGWVDVFADEREQHTHDPVWALLEDHIAVTLGTRVHDREALSGQLAVETAIATSLNGVVTRQARTAVRLLRTYAAASARALLFGGPVVEGGRPSDRALVLQLVRSTLRLGLVGRTWRLGVRRRARGAERQGQAWSLIPHLREVLGEETAKLHPTVVRLFERMDTFEMSARVHLESKLGLPVLARFATVLLGQGMYESHLEDVPARFRLFKRDDGSIHFVREFWCEDAVRVFDSDFVVRKVDGHAELVEVFQDLRVGARMRTEVLADGGLSMTVIGLWVRGLYRRPGPFVVCFTTRPTDDGQLHVLGEMRLQPANAIQRFWYTRVLRLPDRPGFIEYTAVPTKPSEAS